MKQGIIFDLDGVLLSTDEMHYAAWKSVADELGVPFDRTVNNRLRGVSRMESLEIILEKSTRPFSAAEKEALATRKNDRYRALLQSLTPDAVEPAVRETLCALKARGFRLAVGSSSKNTKLILRLTGLAPLFDAVSDGTNITRSKPDPEVFLKAAAFIGLAPADCAVVEDATAGIDAAVAGGFTAIGIGDAATYEKTEIAIHSLSEIPEKI
ncbi:MAG: beta-phosphoglucomutase [Firmicutes bacterium]|nr:beta-phosphoglucomutase [Bacillota bacterium]